MIGPWIFDLIFAVVGRFVGRPIQRWRAGAALKKGRVKGDFIACEPEGLVSERDLAGPAHVRPGVVAFRRESASVSAVESVSDPWDKDTPFWFNPPVVTMVLIVPGGKLSWVVLASQVSQIRGLLQR